MLPSAILPLTHGRSGYYTGLFMHLPTCVAPARYGVGQQQCLPWLRLGGKVEFIIKVQPRFEPLDKV